MDQINKIIKHSENRFQLWAEFLNEKKIKVVLELGVYKGEFAEYLMKNTGDIEKYFMLDPWRKLESWNKPANTNNAEFEKYFEETLDRTKFAKNKINILRGKTSEVIHEIDDNSIDFAYIDGDHTLKGITIDLIQIWSKIKPNGFIAGDDFSPSIWQHEKKFEPTFVFPFAVYFAEAMNTKIIALPFNQFLISKDMLGFEFIDLTKDKYEDLDILNQLNAYSLTKKEDEKINFFKKIFKSL